LFFKFIVKIENLKKKKLDWNVQGNIVFDNVYLKYPNGVDYSLKKVSFSVQPKEKIG